MKRIFCDCCGNEMQYDEAAATVNGKNREAVIGSAKAKMKMEVALIVRAVPEQSGQHIDICTNCKWATIDKFDPRPKAEDAPDVPSKRIQLSLDQVHRVFEMNSTVGTGGYTIDSKKAYDIYAVLHRMVTGESL